MKETQRYTRIAKQATDGAVAIADLPSKRERFTMPHDVTAVVDMQKPWLKYATPVASVTGALLGKKLSKNKSLGLLGGMAAGNLVGSNAHSELEKHYARKYLKKVTEHTDKKYKSAKLGNMIDHKTGTEYIFDAPINWSHELKEQTPGNIRTALEYKHPIASRIPLLGAAIGAGVAYKKKKLLPLAVGLAGGHVARELYFDQKLKPYKKKFIAEANQKYGVP